MTLMLELQLEEVKWLRNHFILRDTLKYWTRLWVNTDAPSPSKKKKKKKNDRTLHASGEAEIEKPPDKDNEVSISDDETQPCSEHSPFYN